MSTISRPGKILLHTSTIIQCSPFDYKCLCLEIKSTHSDEIRNLSEANGMKVQITDKRLSLNTMLKTTYYWLTSYENVQILNLL